MQHLQGMFGQQPTVTQHAQQAGLPHKDEHSGHKQWRRPRMDWHNILYDEQ